MSDANEIIQKFLTQEEARCWWLTAPEVNELVGWFGLEGSQFCMAFDDESSKKHQEETPHVTSAETFRVFCIGFCRHS